MTFAEFVAKHRHIPAYRKPGSPGWLEFIDEEVATIHRDYPPVRRWADVPRGALVFVCWSGGNRGLYVWDGRELRLPGQAPDDRWTGGAPDLGTDRCSNAAWIDVGDVP